jgi:hypothetical protein
MGQQLLAGVPSNENLKMLLYWSLVLVPLFFWVFQVVEKFLALFQ